jgi:hypothetical protein
MRGEAIERGPDLGMGQHGVAPPSCTEFCPILGL